MYTILVIVCVFLIGLYAASTVRLVDGIQTMSFYVCHAAERRSYAEALLRYAAVRVCRDATLRQRIETLREHEEELSPPSGIKKLASLQSRAQYRMQGAAIEIVVKLIDSSPGQVVAEVRCVV